MGTDLTVEFFQRKLEERVLSVDKRIQIYCLSDLHTDHKANFDWLALNAPPKDDLVHTVLVCSGDITHDIRRLEETFLLLKSKYNEVCYLPGNHDLWARGGTSSSAPLSSFEKLNDLLTCCLRCDIIISPLQLISTTHHTLVTLVPLYSWYHSGFDTEPNLTHPLYLKYEQTLVTQNATFDRQWNDFRQCKWSQNVLENHFSSSSSSSSSSLSASSVSTSTSASSSSSSSSSPSSSPVAHYDTSQNLISSSLEDNQMLSQWFSELNEPYLSSLSSSSRDCPSSSSSSPSPSSDYETPFVMRDVISFSHFLPRQELLLEKRFLLEPQLTKVAGSSILERQVRALKSNLHLFGHTHIPICLTLDGIQYLQWPLGNVKESNTSTAVIARHGPLLVYDSCLSLSNPPSKSCVIADNHCASCHWSQYYLKHPREPQLTNELSPWLQSKLEGFLSYY